MNDDLLDHPYWEDDGYDEEGGRDGWARRHIREDEEWTCVFPGDCVMGCSEHHSNECCSLDDAMIHYEMMDE